MITGINKAGRRFWNLQPAAFGDHPGGRILYAYAAQLAFSHWTTLPQLEEPADAAGKPGSAKSIKRTARTQAARAGAFHQVRVLDYTPPPDEPPHPATGATCRDRHAAHGRHVAPCALEAGRAHRDQGRARAPDRPRLQDRHRGADFHPRTSLRPQRPHPPGP
ncbi:hypothetical protein AB0C81_28785 [Streptomyces roseoverticillatus]|uniref:hypothetical protein n=1 Tax=Streptomyces roseoverticillatus TaxID=66429 RepID=UPI0033CB479D